MIERHRNQRHEPATISLMVYQCRFSRLASALTSCLGCEKVNTGIPSMSIPVRIQLFTILATYAQIHRLGFRGVGMSPAPTCGSQRPLQERRLLSERRPVRR